MPLRTSSSQRMSEVYPDGLPGVWRRDTTLDHVPHGQGRARLLEWPLFRSDGTSMTLPTYRCPRCPFVAQDESEAVG